MGFTNSISAPFALRVRGQSNAIGTVLVAGNLPSNLVGLRNGQFAYIDSWQPLQAGVNNSGKDPNNSYYPNRFGFEMRLMDLLYNYFNKDVNLIKYGRGGIQLGALAGAQNDWSSDSVADFYELSNTHYLAAKNTKDFKLIAEIWCQGENDATAPSNYRTDQINFINRSRIACGYNVPFIDISLSSNQTALNSTNRGLINTAKSEIAQYVYNSATGIVTTNSGTFTIANTWLILQNELTSPTYQNDDGSAGSTDNVHYTPNAHNNIANYIFEVIKKIQIG